MLNRRSLLGWAALLAVSANAAYARPLRLKGSIKVCNGSPWTLRIYVADDTHLPAYVGTLPPHGYLRISALSADNMYYTVRAEGEPPALVQPRYFRLTPRKPRASWLIWFR